jgi:Beta/Gamma crystallin
MDFKIPKSQEQSEQRQDEKLAAIAGAGLDTLGKNRSLRGKVAKWAAVTASVVGISVGMVMPAQAVNRANCEGGTFNVIQGPKDPPIKPGPTMCFANRGDARVVIPDVYFLMSGNNAGRVETNKGVFRFGKNEVINFVRKGSPGKVTITRIVIN